MKRAENEVSCKLDMGKSVILVEGQEHQVSLLHL